MIFCQNLSSVGLSLFPNCEIVSTDLMLWTPLLLKILSLFIVTPSGIFLVGGGGYACSGWGAGSGHFEYFVVIFGFHNFFVASFQDSSSCFQLFPSFQ